MTALKNRLFSPRGHSPRLMNRNRVIHPRGMTLVELIVSLFVLVNVATSLMYGFIVTRRIAEATVIHSIATEVSLGFLEQLKRMNYDELQELASDPTKTTIELLNPKFVSHTSKIETIDFLLDKENVLFVATDVRPNSNVPSMKMKFTPKLRDLTFDPSSKLPAVEITLEYAYLSTSTTSKVLINRKVQYVVPKMGQTQFES